MSAVSRLLLKPGQSPGARSGFRRSLSLLTGLMLMILTVGLSGTVQGADDAVLRDRVLQSIRRAQQFLKDQQLRDGSWAAVVGVSEFRNGTTGLAVLALMNSGLTEDDPSVAAGLKYLRSVPLDALEETSRQKPYEFSLMLQALATVRNRDQQRIRKLTDLLVEYQRESGGWRYERASAGNDDWDNSVTQFAVLGLREAAMLGVPVDNKVWTRTRELMLLSQLGGLDDPQGAGWTYTPGSRKAYGSMTVAGLSSLLIVSSMMQQDDDVGPDGRIDCCGSQEDDRVRKSLAAGERWMASHFTVKDNPQNPGYVPLYYLYGLERVGRLGGIRFFGDHDWYREGAEFLVSSQNPRNGAIHQAQGHGLSYPVTDTCFALLFLSKGLAPVVVNKIKYGPTNARKEVTSDDWNRHPRDIANLVDSLTSRSGWPRYLNWQVIDLQKAVEGEGVSALLQAPVQYLSGTGDLSVIDGPQMELLREYVMQGGFLFAVQNCEDTDFDVGFRNLVRRMFPEGDYQLRKLPPTHDIYRSEAVFANNAPELWGVDFGCRTAIVYAPFDHACRWQKWTRYDVAGRRPDVKSQISQSMNLAVNVIAYATNRELVSKLDRPDALANVEAAASPRSAIEIARLRHTGGWDAAPNALRHLKSSLEKLGFSLSAVSPNVAATDATLRNYPISYMHGRKNFALSQDERDGLRSYLENGGVLIADACCGSTQFDASFRELIAQTFGKELETIPVTHELMNLDKLGYDIRRVSRRIPTEQINGSLSTEESIGEPILEGLKIDGRYVVIYSRYDISCALEQQNTQGCAGYSRADAARIATNMVIYSMAQ